MSEKVLFLVSVVVVLAFSGLVQATTPLDVNNYSFEYDCNGNQIQRKVSPDFGCIMGWDAPTGTEWFGATMWCGSDLYVSGQCQGIGATDGEVSAWIEGSDIYAYQVTEHVFEAGKRYTITFDAQGWGATFTPSLFYLEDPCSPDVNHIEVGSEAMLIDSEFPAGPNMWELDLKAEFTSLPGQDYIGKQIGIEFFNASGGGYVFFDNVRLAMNWATDTWDPDPPDEAEDVPIDVNLAWSPGLWAADVNGHEVYFGTSWGDVDSATTATAVIYRGPDDVTGPDANNRYSYDIPEALELGETYYWRVDEVNEDYIPGVNDPPAPNDYRWKGEVWSFTVTGYAYNVYPADGAGNIPALGLTLYWEAGTSAGSHDVYFGTSQADVTDANTANTALYLGVFRGNQIDIDDPNYPVEDLEVGESYYWRIDEVNTATGTFVEGHVWSFTTGVFLIVDSFEPYRYKDTADLKDVWKDWFATGGGTTL